MSGVCVDCIQNCHDCLYLVANPATSCEVCNGGFIANPSRTQCVPTSPPSSCDPAGFMISLGSYNGVSYQTCNTCAIQNCKEFMIDINFSGATCTGGIYTCTTCNPMPNPYLSENGQQCLVQCPDGFFANGQNQCQRCQTTSCKTCQPSSSDICTTCPVGRVLALDSRGCLTQCPMM